MNINIDPNTMVIIAGAVSLLTVLVLLVAICKIVALGKSIQRLSETIPGTSGITAKELGAELGTSIESSFQKYMPQPEKVSAAITSSAEAALKTAASGVDGLHKKFIESQQAIVTKFAEQEKSSAAGLEKVAASISGSIESAMKSALSHVDGLNKKHVEVQGSVLDKWAAHEKNSVTGLEAIRKSLEAASQQLGTGLTGGSQKMQTSLEDGSKKLSDALAAITAKLDSSLKDHSDKTTKASDALAAQLEKIASLEKDIDKLLHLQQATEGTLKSVSTSDDFKGLVKALRDHLTASDVLLREAAKPRTIKMIEQEV